LCGRSQAEHPEADHASDDGAPCRLRRLDPNADELAATRTISGRVIAGGVIAERIIAGRVIAGRVAAEGQAGVEI